MIFFAISACARVERVAPPTPFVDASAPVAAVAEAGAPEPDPADTTVLAVGEAFFMEGNPSAERGNPTNGAIETRVTNPGAVLVIGRRPGLVALRLESGETLHFRVLTELCRDRPLHPAVVLDPEDHADIDDTAVRAVEALRRDPTPAGVQLRAGGVVITGIEPGRTTVLVTHAKGPPALYDVLVGGACADNHYAASAPAIPPGLLGPNGDGTCVRRHGARLTPVACPDATKLTTLPKETFSDLACEWAASCERSGIEGCCVGCKDLFSMKIGRACALRALRATTCADVRRIIDDPSCSN